MQPPYTTNNEEKWRNTRQAVAQGIKENSTYDKLP
jgi:hypothetical protein